MWSQGGSSVSWVHTGHLVPNSAPPSFPKNQQSDSQALTCAPEHHRVCPLQKIKFRNNMILWWLLDYDYYRSTWSLAGRTTVKVGVGDTARAWILDLLPASTRQMHLPVQGGPCPRSLCTSKTDSRHLCPLCLCSAAEFSANWLAVRL